ncbi:MAG: hypothetical protein WCY41_04975 [Candidatus Micrarchaeia archaeon]
MNHFQKITAAVALFIATAVPGFSQGLAQIYSRQGENEAGEPMNTNPAKRYSWERNDEGGVGISAFTGKDNTGMSMIVANCSDAYQATLGASRADHNNGLGKEYERKKDIGRTGALFSYSATLGEGFTGGVGFRGMWQDSTGKTSGDMFAMGLNYAGNGGEIGAYYTPKCVGVNGGIVIHLSEKSRIAPYAQIEAREEGTSSVMGVEANAGRLFNAAVQARKYPGRHKEWDFRAGKRVGENIYLHAGVNAAKHRYPAVYAGISGRF